MFNAIAEFLGSIPFFSSLAFGIIAMVVVGSSWCPEDKFSEKKHYALDKHKFLLYNVKRQMYTLYLLVGLYDIFT